MFSAFLLLLVLPTSSAVFELGTLGCAGSMFVIYDPPITSEVQPVTITQSFNFTTCKGILDRGITAGWSQRVLHNNQSCLSNVTLLQIPSTTITFTWVAPGTRYSTIYFPTGTAVTISGNSQTIQNDGNVTSGTFRGETAALSITIPTLNITACQQGGVGSLNGTAILLIDDLPL